MGEHEINMNECTNTIRLGTMYSILDRALVADPKIANMAEEVAKDVVFVTDDAYLWRRYGIRMAIFKCWLKNRKLFDSDWQYDIEPKAEKLMSEW